MNESLYGKDLVPRKRRNVVRKAANHAAQVYRDYSRFGLRAGMVFDDDEEITRLSNLVASHQIDFKRECVDELRDVDSRLTPSYQRNN